MIDIDNTLFDSDNPSFSSNDIKELAIWTTEALNIQKQLLGASFQEEPLYDEVYM